MSKTKIIYKAAKGAAFTDEEAPIVGATLAAIAKRDGDVTPHAVLDEARDDGSPLHKYFEWDKTKAAYNWNVQQARQLVRCLRVTIEGGNEAPAMLSISVKTQEDEFVRSYRTFKSVTDDPELRKAYVDSLMRDLEVWCKKAEIFSELAPIVAYVRNHGLKTKVA